MSRKLGSVPLGELGPYLTQCCLGRGLPPYQVASLSIQPFGHNKHGSWFTRMQSASINCVSGGWLLCPFLSGEAGSPSNTVWPGPRPASTPSGILIHPTDWPQYTNVTDREDRQTVAQKASSPFTSSLFQLNLDQLVSFGLTLVLKKLLG